MKRNDLRQIMVSKFTFRLPTISFKPEPEPEPEPEPDWFKQTKKPKSKGEQPKKVVSASPLAEIKKKEYCRTTWFDPNLKATRRSLVNLKKMRKNYSLQRLKRKRPTPLQ